MKVYTGESIRKIEQACFDSGISEMRLMENAGVACAKVIRKELDLETQKGKRVVVLCGKGKNGGDGFVIARKLSEIGAEPTIILTHGYPTVAEPVRMLERAKELEIRTIHYEQEPILCRNLTEDADVVVDCIFGIGYHGKCDEKTVEIFDAVNESPAVIVSIDVPSGLDSEGVDYEPRHIRADMTITISTFKPVHINEMINGDCGRIFVVGINIDKRFFATQNPVAEITDSQCVKAFFPQREEDANKGDFGHLMMLCGSYRMPGAAVMSAKAAVRSGVGKITLAFPEPAYAAVASKLNEPLFEPLAADDKGYFAPEARDNVITCLADKSAVLIGCGIGKSLGAQALLETVCKRFDGVLIIDADGINLLSENIYLLEDRKEMTILTPHLGEFARLINKPIEDIKRNRRKYVEVFCERFPNTVLVLKGNNSIIASGDAMLYINPTGNAGLAQAGTGDVLAGLMAGFVASGMGALDSAVAAAYIHGEAGDICAAKKSQRGMSTDDLIAYLPASLIKYEG